MKRTLALLSVTLLFACAKKDDTAKADPDKNSGPDSKRTGAVLVELNKVATDEVDFDKGDQTDWKAVEVKGTGVLNVELHWDNGQSNVDIDVYDGAGTQLGASPAPSGNPIKKIPIQIDKEGTYYLRVQAPKTKDSSVYTVEAKWLEPPPPPAAVAAEPPPPPKEKKVVEKAPKEKKPPKEKKGGTEVQGRIVSSYKEGGSLVIYLDKGSAAGVKPGDTGAILDGSSGGNLLDGGAFSVTQVIDGSKSIGKATLKSIGKNTRVNIYVH